jgi:hypothetical protein
MPVRNPHRIAPEGKPGWTARHADPAGFSPGHRNPLELEEYIPVTETDRSTSVPSSAMAKALTWITGTCARSVAGVPNRTYPRDLSGAE